MKSSPTPEIVQVRRAAGQQPRNCTDRQAGRSAEHADETSKFGSEKSSERPSVILLLYGCPAICVLGKHNIGVEVDATLIVQPQKRVLALIRFCFSVKDDYQDSVHDGFAPLDLALSYLSVMNAMQAPLVSSSKRSDSDVAESESLREFAKFVKIDDGS